MNRQKQYDRELLLFGAKRNAVLELSEVQRYGMDSYGDPDYVSIYGMRPPDWHAKGARVLGRTAVECTRDGLGDAIGKDVAAIAAPCPDTSGMLVVDPFAGSGNTLYWLLRHLPGALGPGGFAAHSEKHCSSGVAHRHPELRLPLRAEWRLGRSR